MALLGNHAKTKVNLVTKRNSFFFFPQYVKRLLMVGCSIPLNMLTTLTHLSTNLLQRSILLSTFTFLFKRNLKS